MRGTPTLLAAIFATAVSLAQSADPAHHVNPFIGTTNGGHVFSGATLPFGSVKAGADSASNDNQGGYVSDGSPIMGISQLHDDGTGGGASLGNFPLLPMTSQDCAGNDLTKCPLDPFSRAIAHSGATGSPGYFGISLNNGVKAEVTVTQHAALHRFTYANGTNDLLLLLDSTGDLTRSYLGDGSIAINVTRSSIRIAGNGRFIPSFGESDYKVYYCLDTRAPTQAKYFSNSGGTAYQDVKGSFNTDIAGTNPAGVLMAFAPGGDGVLNVRMGISWTSSDKACAFAEQEIPDLGGFETVKSAARAKWNELLGTVEVDTTGVTEDTQQLFWSSLYRAYISPTNITGDNPLWQSSEPFYDSFYCIWDSFRIVHPLWTVTAPNPQAEIVRALIDIYRHTGWLPDCRMSLDKGFTQGGSNADSILSDTFVKGITAGIDWTTGFAAMLKDATVEGDFTVEGRGGISARSKLGYVPVDDNDNPPNEGPNTRSASRLVEYAYNDFGIALVAKGFGKSDVAQEYFKKSRDWRNIWNPNATSTGFSGFIQPRNADGSWYISSHDKNGVFDPTHCSPVNGPFDCFLNPTGGEFYESSSWEYSFYVPQDMATLVQLMGGPKTFSSRLDTLFAKGYHEIGDEPGFLHPYLYNYAGQPAKTVDRVESILNAKFNTSLNGIPGNDDSGAMGSFVVFAHLGFYPIAGQSTYILSRPRFPKITIHNQATGAAATIISTNFGGSNKYIQSAKLNGQPYTKNWITHDIFSKGGTLELIMGSKKDSKFGTGSGDLPPSLSTGGFQ